MGVHNLWPILDSVAEKQPLSFLEGKTVAVDLSIWIVQSKQQKGLNECKKPHLKNLFYRTKYLLTNKVSPIFVFDGKPPKVKENIIKDRNINQYSKLHNENYSGGSGQRENYIESLQECEELLQILGVPYLKSYGEAESLCAYLNSKGIVDGCITEDSDTFLYGAETVFRGFNLQNKEVKVYTINDIKSELNMNREKLVALALLLGSDYKKGGVTGIGKETALNMIKEVEDKNIIQRFYDYKTKSQQELFPNYSPKIEQETISHCIRCKHSGTKIKHQRDGCLMCACKTYCLKKKKNTCICKWHKNDAEKNKIKYELKVYQKVSVLDGFPDKEKQSVNWFGKSAENIMKHILSIITAWQIKNIAKGVPANCPEFYFSPIKIIKEKTEKGRKLFLVQWCKKGSNITSEDLYTDERIEDFSETYPVITSEYKEVIADRKKSPMKRIPSPAKAKVILPDLMHNSQIKDFFPVVKKRPLETNETEVKNKLKAI